MKPYIQFPALYARDVVVHSCNPSTKEVGAEEPKFKVHPQLRSEFEPALAREPFSNKQNQSCSKTKQNQDPNPMVLMILLLSGKINQSNVNFEVTVNHI